MNRCVIVGAAPADDLRYMDTLIADDDFLIAADGGYNTLLQIHRVPAMLVADFDSAERQSSYPAGVDVCVLPVRKDDTDTLAAAKMAVDRGYTDFLLLGCMGGRLDHTFANLQVMAWLNRQGCRVQMADKGTLLTMLSPGNHVLEFVPDRGFSLLAYDEPVTSLTVQDASYTVEDATLTTDIPLGVSNAFLPNQPVKISFATGRLLVLLCKE